MLVGVGLGVILAAGVCVLLLRRRPILAERIFAVLVAVGAATAAASAVGVLTDGRARMVALASGVPGGAWAFGLDRLSAWFLLTILGAGTAAAIYGADYLAPERHERPTAAAHALLAVLLVALAGVVTSQAVVPFLIAWEVMAVSAFLLVIFESEQAEVRRAGFIYLVLMHASTIALLAMFAGWGHGAAELTFEALADAGLPAGSGGFILALALVGFGIKAGVVPLHFWLPGAHAAAPSHVSAVLSGVMLKMGIYGLLRVMSLVGVIPVWWGWTLLGLGLVSGVLGVLWALAQHDLKRLLAYHSVENIGIILLGIGVGALGISYGQPVVAVLGLTGAVLHTLNHALFKSLLFLGAGAVVRATGTRMIDQLGGVARRMPLTAAAFLVGSVAIVGLPPLNGFVSEWVVFLALLRSGEATTAMRVASVAAPGLALIGGLALACFTKVDGVVFLGHARSPSVIATERGLGSVGPMLALAAACLAIGFYPALAVAPAVAVGMSVAAGATMPAAELAALNAALPRVALMALGVVALGALVWLVRDRLVARASAARSGTWGCAGAPLTARMQYTASSYAAPLLAAFGPLAGVRARAETERFHSQPIDLVLDGMVSPAWRRVGRMAREARLFQAGRLRWYLLYVILTLLALLLYIGYTPRSG
ncbi:MAG: proton-conducting transporter membrane subunit [Gemmatimonadales bacterium]